MKAIVKKKLKKNFILTDVNEPEIKLATEVKIKMLYSGICGTDVHIDRWDEWAQKNIKNSIITGHEGVGKVIKIGSNVTKVKIGDYVAIESHIYDGVCQTCLKGGYRVCENLKIIGIDTNGTWCQYFVMPEKNLFKLNDAVPLKLCSILEPFGNAFHTQSVSKIKGKNILITGDGPIAIFAALIVRTQNPKHLFITGINEYRKKIIRELGFNLIDPIKIDLKKQIIKETAGEGIDVVLEFSGSISALKSAVDIVNPLGDINVLSLYSQQEVPVALNLLTSRNVRMQFIYGRKIWSTWNKGYALIKNKKIPWENIEKVISHVIPIQNFKKAFKLLEKNKASKIIMTFKQ